MGDAKGGGVVMSGKRSRKEKNLAERNCSQSGWWEDKDGGERKVTERLKSFKGQCKCKRCYAPALLCLQPSIFSLQFD